MPQKQPAELLLDTAATAATAADITASARLYQRLEKATVLLFISTTASQMEVGSKSATRFFPHLSKFLKNIHAYILTKASG